MKSTLYLDMDGVVADFDEYAYRMLGVLPSGGIYPDAVWQKLAANPRIYRDLKKTPEADELVAKCKVFCKEHNYDLKFLTAVPKGNDVPWAFYDKMTWALFFFPDIPVMFGPYSKDKHHHCRRGDILIDDRTSNVEEWTAAGGYGILYDGQIIEQIKDQIRLAVTGHGVPWDG
jgi:5'(3')-deoxyribonucleotidase